MTGFEVNTDSEFIDPDWDLFAELHDRRYSLAISYVKSVVEGTSLETVEGTSFDNAVMDLRVGAAGFYVQSKNFPAAFYGDTGASSHDFVSAEAAQEAVFDAVALYRAGDARSLTCVYSDSTPGDVFFGYRVGGERYELGFMRPSLPLHLRVMVDASEDTDLLGDTKGVLIYQRTADGRHLLIRAPGRRQPFLLLEGFTD